MDEEQEQPLTSTSVLQIPDSLGVSMAEEATLSPILRGAVSTPRTPPPSSISASPNSRTGRQRQDHGERSDMFTEQFSLSVDDLMHSFRAQAMQAFLMSEKSMSRTHQADLNAQQTEYEAVIAERDTRINNSETNQLKLTQELEQKKNVISGLINLSRRMRESLYCRNLVGKAWLRWRIWRKINNDDKIIKKMTDPYWIRRMCTRAWQAWSRHVRTSLAERKLKNLATEKDLEKANIIQEATMQQEKLEHSVRTLQELLDQEIKAKKNVQENLKTVFMRGVCALNFEAMSLLDDKPMARISEDQLGMDLSGVHRELDFTHGNTLNFEEDTKENDMSMESIRGNMNILEVSSSPIPKKAPTYPRSAPNTSSPKIVDKSSSSKVLAPHPLPFVSYTASATRGNSKSSRWVDATPLERRR